MPGVMCRPTHAGTSLAASRSSARPGRAGADNGHHPDAHVEDPLHLAGWHLPSAGQQAEHRGRAPGGPVDRGVGARRQHPGEVGGQPAAGDVRERVHVAAIGQGKAVAGVDTRRGQQLIPQRRAEPGRHGVQRQPAAMRRRSVS